ncbi:MAG: winged helix-turn-helix domain-containing protein [Solirubrobacteraceae bacterium]
MLDLDQIRRDIQARLQELWDEIDKLRRALTALTSRENEPASGDGAAPASGSAPESPAKSAGGRARRTPRTSEKPRSAAAPARARTAPGATKAAILAALRDGGAMTAGEIAAASGLGRATVSTTLSKLAASGDLAKAARGYQLQRESDTPAVDGAPGRPAPRRIRPSRRAPSLPK